MGARQIVVTPQARRDLEAIIDWYRRRMGASVAAKAARSIQAGIRLAATIEPAAASRPDLPDGFFRVVAKAHLVIFQISGPQTRIVRIVHGARDILTALSVDDT